MLLQLTVGFPRIISPQTSMPHLTLIPLDMDADMENELLILGCDLWNTVQSSIIWTSPSVISSLCP